MKLLKYTPVPGIPLKPLDILLHSQMPSKLHPAQGSTWFFPQPSFPQHSPTRHHSQNSRLSITDTGLQCLLPLHTQPHVCAQQTAFSTTQFRCQHQSRSPSSYRVWLYLHGYHKSIVPCLLLWLKCALKPRARPSSSWQ